MAAPRFDELIHAPTRLSIVALPVNVMRLLPTHVAATRVPVLWTVEVHNHAPLASIGISASRDVRWPWLIAGP